MLVSFILKPSSHVQNAFVPQAKSVRLQHNKHILLLFGSWLKNPKRTDTREKSFCKTSFQLRLDGKKWPKQGKNERTQEDYCTSAVYFFRCHVVFLHKRYMYFIFALFLCFMRSVLNWKKVLQKLFSLYSAIEINANENKPNYGILETGLCWSAYSTHMKFWHCPSRSKTSINVCISLNYPA